MLDLATSRFKGTSSSYAYPRTRQTSCSKVMNFRTGNSTCPLAMLETYLARTGTQLSDHRFLFRPICKTARPEMLRGSGNISYTCLGESFRKKLKELGYNPDNFGLHSLRAGGATAAANNGIPDRLFKRHRRWKSDNAKDGYVEDLMEHRMEVTRQIGL